MYVAGRYYVLRVLGSAGGLGGNAREVRGCFLVVDLCVLVLERGTK